MKTKHEIVTGLAANGLAKEISNTRLKADRERLLSSVFTKMAAVLDRTMVPSEESKAKFQALSIANRVQSAIGLIKNGGCIHDESLSGSVCPLCIEGILTDAIKGAPVKWSGKLAKGVWEKRHHAVELNGKTYSVRSHGMAIPVIRIDEGSERVAWGLLHFYKDTPHILYRAEYLDFPSVERAIEALNEEGSFGIYPYAWIMNHNAANQGLTAFTSFITTDTTAGWHVVEPPPLVAFPPITFPATSSLFFYDKAMSFIGGLSPYNMNTIVKDPGKNPWSKPHLNSYESPETNSSSYYLATGRLQLPGNYYDAIGTIDSLLAVADFFGAENE